MLKNGFGLLDAWPMTTAPAASVEDGRARIHGEGVMYGLRVSRSFTQHQAGDAEDHDVGDDERGGLHDVVLRDAEHDRARTSQTLKRRRNEATAQMRPKTMEKKVYIEKNPLLVIVRQAGLE